jgi:type IV secretion system protein VirB5
MNLKLNTQTERSVSAKEKWNELFTKPMMEKRQLLVFALGSFVMNIVLLAGYVTLSSRSQVAVWVVEVDHAGKAAVTGQAKKIELNDDKVIRAYVCSFIEMARTVITDPEAMRVNFTKVYEMATPEVQNFLNIYYRENNPMEEARKKSRQIVPTAFLKQSDKTFIVEWKETERDLTNKVLSETQWKALITITSKEPKTNKEVMENPYNPFGIYITNISWSSVL